MQTPTPNQCRRCGQLAAAAALLSLVHLTGCTTSPRSGELFDPLAVPEGNTKVASSTPTEAGFLDLVRTYCGEERVGDATLVGLLDTDPRFRALTTDLYHGELTNDGYMRAVLTRHPAPDANVDATGCVVKQLQKCFGGRCAVPAPTRPLPERDPPTGMEAYDTGPG